MKKILFLLSSVAILALVPACNWKFWEKKHAAKPAAQAEAAPIAPTQPAAPAAAQSAPATDNK